jgi:hypothetical protein
MITINMLLLLLIIIIIIMGTYFDVLALLEGAVFFLRQTYATPPLHHQSTPNHVILEAIHLGIVGKKQQKAF